MLLDTGRSIWRGLMGAVALLGTIAGTYYYVTGDHLLHLLQHWH